MIVFLSTRRVQGAFLPEKPGERCKLHQGPTSCLDAGGTLATRLNSNYACMGLPPDDMIGILTQTNIQNRIREKPNTRHLIQRCSCVISFKMPFSPFFVFFIFFLFVASHRSGLHRFVFKVSTKFFFFLLVFFQATFP